MFDVRRLAEYHRKNLTELRNSLWAGVDFVVVDNTNIHPWETRPYTDAAWAAGYRIVFLNVAPRAFLQHVAAQRVTPEKPAAHEVPPASIREHIDSF